jgi:plasmid stability protein
MCGTCFHVQRMGMIQIRNVPDDLHRKLKARAAAAGLSLSDYLLRMAERDAARLTMAELQARLQTREPVTTDTDPVDIIREARGPI